MAVSDQQVVEPAVEAAAVPQDAPAPAPEPLAEAGLKALQAEREARKEAERAAREAQSRLAELERQALSEQERAVIEAREEGRKAAESAWAQRTAEAEFRAALVGKVSDVDTLLETVDVSRFVKDGDVDRDAIAATSEKLSKLAPAAPAGYPPVELGPKNGTPGQLSTDDLKSMSPDQIAEAFAAGRLKNLGFG